MRPQEYVAALRDGHTSSGLLDGLYGRFLHGPAGADFRRLSGKKDRRFVMVFGPDGLHRLLQDGATQMQLLLGHEPAYLRRLIDEGQQFRLVVFRPGDPLPQANWDGVERVVRLAYPDMVHRVGFHRQTLEETLLAEFERQLGYTFAEVDRAGPEDPRYMTHKRFRRIPDTAANTRAFLYFSMRLLELYQGDGFTRTHTGEQGVREFFFPNMALAKLGEYAVCDLTVPAP